MTQQTGQAKEAGGGAGPDRHNPFPAVLNSNNQGSTIAAKLPARSAPWDSEDSKIQPGQAEQWSSPTLRKDDGFMNSFVT